MSVCPVLSSPVCPVCNVGVLWPNGWMDQDKIWHAGRPRALPHCVRREPTPPTKAAQQPPLFLAHVCCGHGRSPISATAELLLLFYMNNRTIILSKLHNTNVNRFLSKRNENVRIKSTKWWLGGLLEITKLESKASVEACRAGKHVRVTKNTKKTHRSCTQHCQYAHTTSVSK